MVMMKVWRGDGAWLSMASGRRIMASRGGVISASPGGNDGKRMRIVLSRPLSIIGRQWLLT